MNEDYTNTSGSPPPPAEDRRVQQVWGPRYIDEGVLFRTKTRGESQSDGDFNTAAYDEPRYQITDAQFSVVAVLDGSSFNPRVLERVRYSPYGVAGHTTPADFNGDGLVKPGDMDDFITAYYDTPPHPTADFNRDGFIEPGDIDDFITAYYEGPGSLEAGALSQHGNEVGYCGYQYNQATVQMAGGSGLYTVRFRHYAPGMGRWIERDPAGYVDGMGVYEYARSASSMHSDPMGLDIGPDGDQRPGPIRREDAPSPASGRAMTPRKGVCLNWQGTWSASEKERVEEAIGLARRRAVALASEVSAAKAKLSVCELAEIGVDLNTLKRRMDDLVALLDDPNKTIKLYQEAMDDPATSPEAETKPERWPINPYTLLNNSKNPSCYCWTTLTKEKLAALLMHEFAHIVEGPTNFDDTDKLYNPQYIDRANGLFVTSLEQFSSYQALLRKARAACKRKGEPTSEVPTSPPATPESQPGAPGSPKSAK